jgi:hypothetical protein
VTAAPDLETRLRSGLRAAADALPHAEPADPEGAGDPSGPGHPVADTALRRRPVGLAAAVAALVALAGVAAVVATADDGGEGTDVATEPTPPPSADDTTTPTTGGPAGVLGDEPGPPVEPVAGAAVIADDRLVTYGPDGRRAATVPLAPLERAQAAAADRRGGWIVCGTPAAGATPTIPEGGTAPTSTVPVTAGATVWELPDQRAGGAEARIEELEAEAQTATDAAQAPGRPNAYRFQIDQEPVPLGVNVYCVNDSLSVTEVDGHPVLLYVSPATFSGRQLDLVTGADSALQIDVGDAGLSDVAVGGGRLAVLGDAGLALWDLATGDPVAVGPVDLPVRPAGATSGPFTADLEMAPDGATLAALVGEVSASADLVVFDLATGDELLRRADAATMEGSQLSFDGTSVAVTNVYDGQTTVLDVGTGAERIIRAHGVLP